MPAGFGVELETEVAGLVVAEEVGASDESKSA
jgi:hypothetical protein